MQRVRAIGAILMLALLTCLGAECFAAARGALHGEHTENSLAPVAGFSAPASAAAGEGGACADPCHYGFAHLGHCLAFLPPVSGLAPRLASSWRWKETFARFPSPALAGFRRPPRTVV